MVLCVLYSNMIFTSPLGKPLKKITVNYPSIFLSWSTFIKWDTSVLAPLDEKEKELGIVPPNNEIKYDCETWSHRKVLHLQETLCWSTPHSLFPPPLPFPPLLLFKTFQVLTRPPDLWCVSLFEHPWITFGWWKPDRSVDSSVCVKGALNE